MTHTPGPWAYIGNGDVVARSDKYCGGEKDIASVFLTVNDEDEANARLIAAAPDLLEALHAIRLCEFNSMSSRQEMMRLAQTAIAKATGAQS